MGRRHSGRRDVSVGLLVLVCAVTVREAERCVCVIKLMEIGRFVEAESCESSGGLGHSFLLGQNHARGPTSTDASTRDTHEVSKSTARWTVRSAGRANLWWSGLMSLPKRMWLDEVLFSV